MKSRFCGSYTLIAVDIDVHAAGGKVAQFRPAVDGEAGHEIAARVAVAAGEECGLPLGSSALLSPSSLFCAGSRRLSLMVSVKRSSGSGFSKNDLNFARRNRRAVIARRLRRQNRVVVNDDLLDRHHAVGIANHLRTGRGPDRQ